MAEATGARCAALVGHYLSGKTTLLEALLYSAGAINRKGTTKEGNTVGDSSPVARNRQMSVELSAANCQFMGDDWTRMGKRLRAFPRQSAVIRVVACSLQATPQARRYLRRLRFWACRPTRKNRFV